MTEQQVRSLIRHYPMSVQEAKHLVQKHAKLMEKIDAARRANSTFVAQGSINSGTREVHPA